MVDSGPAPLEEIRVTGTNLHGAPPVGAEVLTFDRVTIDESGVATVRDFLRTTPQTFGAGPTQDTRLGHEAQTNSGLGTGINLRGLGARATLVLLNGRRLASSGTSAEFVDIESIPLAAVERIDILPDSASALYGADAVGGVVNFLMRKNFTGAESIVRAGAGTPSAQKEYLVAQTLGRAWTDGHAMISVEFYRRDALPASARSYAVSDLRPFGGNNFDTLFANPGNIIAGARTWAIPAGQDGSRLSAASLTAGTANLQNQYLDADLVPSQERYSLYASGRQELGGRVSVFSDVLYSYRDANEKSGGLGLTLAVPSSNPFYVNPSGGTGPVVVAYNFGRDLGPLSTDVIVRTTNATLGVDFDAGAGWTIGAYYTYAREKEDQSTRGTVNTFALNAALASPDPATAFNPFGDGSHTNPSILDGIRMTSPFRASSELHIASMTVDGPIARLPAGALKLAIGADRRDQFFTSIMPPSATLPAGDRADLSRQVSAIFAELVAPLFGEHRAYRGLRKLEWSAAVRYESYSGVDRAATPKYGLVWSPAQGLEFRGTWTRAIRAPTLADLYEKRNVTLPQILPDSSSLVGRTPVLLWTGQNAALREEHAESWTAGLNFAPQEVPGLAVGLTYFAIAFRDRIQSTTPSANLLSDPAFASLVTRNPTPELVSSICGHSIYLGSGGSAGCASFPAGAIVDLRVHNVARLTTHGIDLNGGYERQGAYGKLKFALSGTWLLGFSQAEAPNVPVRSLLNTQNNPVNLRLRGSVGWERGLFGVTAWANFTNGYRDVVSQPNRSVRSWTTIDLHTRFDIPAHDRDWLENTRIELNAENLFNRSPPFLNNPLASLGYDQENADPDGRIVSLEIRKSW